ncbi:hypothetical protein Q31b_37010 [Novipirellula aureliae]|uniref:Uncharacterized protein n=1 Tax=Novipirellula aureliae TaxID=2527966 RepID=A0A5C6DUH5_9BACT|nr:hypothetical protein Q31b_37010 [Novipirellula aureliae]
MHKPVLRDKGMTRIDFGTESEPFVTQHLEQGGIPDHNATVMAGPVLNTKLSRRTGQDLLAL